MSNQVIEPKKDTVVIVRLSPIQKARIKALAKYHGYASMSDFIRTAALLKLSAKSMAKN